MSGPDHACTVCSQLPPFPQDERDVDEDVEYRPRVPRPAPYGGPRSRRCTTHNRAYKLAKRAKAAATRRQTRYGVSPELAEALWEVQGRRCPCGRQPTREPDTDHDHALAREHDHPEDHGCPLCVRGRLCRGCNTYVIGRYSAKQLRDLADYLDHPPMEQLREAS